MNNPFSTDEKITQTGFYFDTSYNRVVYAYKDPSYETTYMKYYSRMSEQINLNHTDSFSIVEDMIENEPTIIDKDIAWMMEDTEKIQTFKDFLMKEEFYLVLNRVNHLENYSRNNQEKTELHKGDLVVATDDFYAISKKSQNFVGKILSIQTVRTPISRYENIVCRVMNHNDPKYIGKEILIEDKTKIRKILY